MGGITYDTTKGYVGGKVRCAPLLDHPHAATRLAALNSPKASISIGVAPSGLPTLDLVRTKSWPNSLAIARLPLFKAASLRSSAIVDVPINWIRFQRSDAVRPTRTFPTRTSSMRSMAVFSDV